MLAKSALFEKRSLVSIDNQPQSVTFNIDWDRSASPNKERMERAKLTHPTRNNISSFLGDGVEIYIYIFSMRQSKAVGKASVNGNK